MLNLGKKKDDEDPKKGLEKADKFLNKGLSGALTKGFMGKDFVDKMNSSLAMGQNAIAGMEQGQWLMQNGLEATAEVVSVQDTGATVNNSPVVLLSLKVTPSTGASFQTAGQTMVSRIAVPRAGDKVRIKYNPADQTQFVIV
jgi:hypothetical protein